jgi:hypothetical protein
VAREATKPGAEPSKEKLIPVKGKDGKWHINEVRHRAFSGVYVRSSGSGRTKEECLKSFWERFEVNRRKGSRRKRVTVANADLKLTDKMSRAFTAYVEECETRVKQGTLSERTLQSYKRGIYPGDENDFRTREDTIRLEIEMGALSIGEAGQPRFLMDYLADVADEVPGVAELHYKVLSGVFTMLKKKYSLFDYSPMKLVDHPCPRGPEKKQRALTHAERRELIRVAQRHRDSPRTAKWLHPFILFVLGTGVRPGEGLALRWCDIFGLNDERAVARIDARVVKVAGRKPYRKPGRKSGNPYYVTLPSWLTALLREYQELSDPEDEETLIFRARNGGKNGGIIDPTTADDMLKRLRAGTAVDWVQFGNLRDTVATEVAGRTGDDDRAGAQLGHAGASSVASRFYIDPNGYRRKAVDNADALEHLGPESDGKMTISGPSGDHKAA